MQIEDYDEYEDLSCDNFNILDLKDLERDKEIQKVILLNQQMKYLQQQKRFALSRLAEEGISEKMFQAVLKAHKGILDSELEVHLSDILKDSFADKEELLFLLENKNKPFYRSSEVFDNFSEHKVQKVLVKDKLLSKRSIKKQKTAGQHITYVKQAKDSVDRLSVMQKQLDELRQEVMQNKADTLNLKLSQRSLSNRIGVIEDEISETLNMLLDKVNDSRKVTVWKLKEDSELHPENIAKMFNVSRRTIDRWHSEISKIVHEIYVDKNVHEKH